MQDILDLIRASARGLWNYRWWGFLATLAVGSVGTLVIMAIPNQYEAGARVYVDTQSILKPLMAGRADMGKVSGQVKAALSK